MYNYTKANSILRRAFAAWTNHVLLPRALPHVDIPQLDDLLEIKDMLTDHSRSWTHQWKMEGIAEGRKEGLKEGLHEGQQKGAAEVLTTLIVSKFGHIPDWAKARITQADETALTRWAVRVLEAQRVEDVFG